MKYGLYITGLALLIAGCPFPFDIGDNGGVVVCTAIFVYGLNVTVTDDMGDPFSGATLTLTEGTYTETMAEFQTGQFAGAGERAGTYTLTIEANGFDTITLNNILITKDECHVIPVVRDVTLTTAGRFIICTAEYVYGLNVFLTDQNDERWSGATLTATAEDYIEIMQDWGDGWYGGAGERSGLYSITIEAEVFDIVKLYNIYLGEDECHVDRKYSLYP